MKLKNLTKYPNTLINIGFKGTIKLLFSFPYYHYKGVSTRYFEKKVNDYKMLLDLKDSGISRELFLYGTREKEHFLFLKESLKGGMVVLDIGANIGYYSVMMGRMVGKNGKVYAVEPSTDNFNLLSLNIKLNKMDEIVDLFNIGFSNKTGVGKFYRSSKSNWHTFYPKVHSKGPTESLENETPIDVPVTTIGDFSKGRRKIDLIRMDIEGFEVEVLEGLIQVLNEKNFIPKILFEVHQPRYDEKEHSMMKCLENLFRVGYKVGRMASHITNGRGPENFQLKGYKPIKTLKTDGVKREIFNNISNEDAIDLICNTNYVRTVLLEWAEGQKNK